MIPLVSVVIPCFNAERYIWDCVSSVIKQDYEEIEIIIVDDYSTDESPDVILKLMKLFGGIKVIHNLKNLGECKTSAKGFAEAKGKYICRLSADDMFVSSNHISIQVAEIEKYNLDWCYNSKSLVGETVGTAKESQTAWMPIPIRYSAKFFNIFDNLFLRFQNICYIITINRNPINSSSLMIRAETYHKSLTWDSSLRSVCDGTLIGKMFLMGFKVRAIPTLGSFYRIHPEQATGKPETNLDLAALRERLKAEIKNNTHPLWMKIIMRCIYG
jgi:glycosyltransferase involved in cell wall biosynthesis